VVWFGSVCIIWGDKAGRFPFSNSVYVEDRIRVLIDAGAGLEKLEPLGEDIDLVLSSHYHLDH